MKLEKLYIKLVGNDFTTSPATPSPSATVVIASTYESLAMNRLKVMRLMRMRIDYNKAGYERLWVVLGGNEGLWVGYWWL